MKRAKAASRAPKLWRDSGDAAHGVLQLTGVENVRNNDLGAAALQQIAAGVTHPDGGAYGATFGQQLGDDGPTGFSGDQNLWVNHGRYFNWMVRYGTDDEAMVRIRTLVK
jgi:hypothetical protein